MKINYLVNLYTAVLLSAFLLMVYPLCAKTVEVAVPGTLHTLVDDTGATEFTVQGCVNASDLYWIGAEMPSLSSLNLAQAEIHAYSGPMLNGRVSYPPATIPTAAFAGSSLTSLILPATQPLTIAEGAFAGSYLTDIVLADNVTTVGHGAFSSCPALRSVTLTPSATYGSSVFADCPALENVNLNGLTSIADGMFSTCTALTTVNGDSLVTYIGPRSFMGCKALQRFVFGNVITDIGASAFQNSGLVQVDLSAASALRTVGDFAFANNESLTRVFFNPDAPTRISRGAFLDCYALTYITLPVSLTQLNDFALKGTASATDLPTALDSIGAYALKDNLAVTSLTLPTNLAYIGDGAMEGMTSLLDIDASQLQSVPALGNDVWAGIDQSAVTLKAQPAAIDLFRNANQWQNFNITGIDGATEIVADGTNGVPEIKARFNGTDLLVNCNGADIATITLHDAAGALLLTTSPKSNSVTIATASFATRLYIISTRLTDGRIAVLKLVR